MFLFHAAYSLGLIALATGVALYVWSSRTEGSGTALAKVFGFLIMIFAIGSLVCTSYFGIKYWRAGYFESPMGMHGMMDGKRMSNGMMMGMPGMMNQQSNQPMMEKCMMNCKNMSGGMMGSPGMNKDNQTNNNDHTLHHPQ